MGARGGDRHALSLDDVKQGSYVAAEEEEAQSQSLLTMAPESDLRISLGLDAKTPSMNSVCSICSCRAGEDTCHEIQTASAIVIRRLAQFS